jgi:AAA+ superfamily predicted ATPase
MWSKGVAMTEAFDPGVIVAVLEVIEQRLKARSTDPLELDAYPVSWLGERLGLTATEQLVLWLLIAHELSPGVRQSIRELNTEEVADPALDTMRRVVYGNAPSPIAWRELGAWGSLRRLALIERCDEGGELPLHRQLVKLAPRVLALAHGEHELDAEIASLATIDDTAIAELEVADEVRGQIQREIAEYETASPGIHVPERGDAHPVTALALLAPTDRAIAGPQGATAEGARSSRVTSSLVIVRGGIGTGRRSLLVSVAREHGHRVLLVDGTAIAKERERAARQLRIVARECALLGLVPLVRQLDALTGTSEVPDRMDLIESELSGLVLATTTRPIARRWRRAPTMVELPALTGVQRARLWKRALPMASPSDADLLATMYPLAPALIEAAGAASMRACGDGEMQPPHIEAGIRSVLDDRLAGLATRITVTQTWEDLILPDEQCTAVCELLARIRERRRVYEDWGFAKKVGRGLGVSALFSGPPGTGKTMCAGLVARELGTELYQVDLSKIVSKWIGETEKNLGALFDAAEAGHAILLFDEADAIFGKRTEVKSSNDRHANQETNYLLQRLESFAGICVLTTNHETAIDEAFRRRLSVHVRFPTPESEDRKRLWQALIPATAPAASDLRFDQLAETYAMSGGYIRNAVLRAAFLAADQNARIDATLLARAAQLEYEAMGKVVARR